MFEAVLPRHDHVRPPRQPRTSTVPGLSQLAPARCVRPARGSRRIQPQHGIWRLATEGQFLPMMGDAAQQHVVSQAA
jgi:hypothetical protein